MVVQTVLENLNFYRRAVITPVKAFKLESNVIGKVTLMSMSDGLESWEHN